MDTKDLATLSADDVIRAIMIGCADSNLRGIEHAVKQRNAAKGGVYRIGDKIVLNGTVRPQYLQGVTGVVKKINQKRVVVDFDEGQDTGRFGRFNVTVPFDLLDKA